MATDIVPSSPISENTRDNEQKKFAENEFGNVVVRVEDETGANLFSGSLLQGVSFDYGSVAYPNSTTEIYTYRLGGALGLVVATVTLVYTTPGKAFLSNFSVVKP